MLKFICKKLAEEESEMRKMKVEFDDCLQAQRSPIQMVQTQMDQMSQNLKTIMNIYKKVKLDDQELEETQFGKKTDDFLQEIEPQVQESVETMKQIHEEFEKTCDFFMLDKGDERRQHSEKFFEFFNEVFENVEKSFPKVTRKTGIGLNPAMLAELQKRQAQMKKA